MREPRMRIATICAAGLVAGLAGSVLAGGSPLGRDSAAGAGAAVRAAAETRPEGAAGPHAVVEEAPAEVMAAVNRAMGEGPAVAAADVAGAAEEKHPTFGGLLVRVGGVLVFILGLLYVSLLGMKRAVSKGRPGLGEQIRVLGRTPLSAKANVYLLRFGDRYLVVGEAGDRLTALACVAMGETAGAEAEEGMETAGGARDGFRATLEGQEARTGADDTLRRITEGVKKLRQETEKLLKVHPRSEPRSGERVYLSPADGAGRPQAAGVEAP